MQLIWIQAFLKILRYIQGLWWRYLQLNEGGVVSEQKGMANNR